MRNPKPVAIVAFILVLGLLLPSLCFGLTSGGVALRKGWVPVGCHGHNQIPDPAHSCCYAGQQIPSATPITPTSVVAAFVTEWVSTPMDPQSVADLTLSTAANDSSPPGPLVLRI